MSNGKYDSEEKIRPFCKPLYIGQNLVLSLPSGKTLRNVKWISVWCEEFEVNFGEVIIPDRFKYPRPQKIDSFNGIHEVSNFYFFLKCLFYQTQVGPTTNANLLFY